MPQLTLWVNGERRHVDAPDAIPLLWLLRDQLGLTGTKFGCGRGLCGACTVLLDDVPIRSCQMPAAMVGEGRVTTIEGLAAPARTPDGLHPVQRAWIAEDVPQCGYCQAGQILSAAALLARNRDPDDAAIDGAMRGNLCRCGTYERIRRAIHRAATEAAGA